VIAALFDRALYVEPDVQSIKDAEERERREMLAQSAIVRHARVCHAEFWSYVDQRGRRLRVVGGQDVEGRG
jgi:hypothetical protein